MCNHHSMIKHYNNNLKEYIQPELDIKKEGGWVPLKAIRRCIDHMKKYCIMILKLEFLLDILTLNLKPINKTYLIVIIWIKNSLLNLLIKIQITSTKSTNNI